MKRRKYGGRSNQKGRSKTNTFVMLMHHMMDSDAWQELSAYGKVAYIALCRRYNGFNNGEISLSVTEAANQIPCSRGKAHTVLYHELVEHGLVRLRNKGHRGNGHASTWVITCHPTQNAGPTNEWKKYISKKTPVH